MAAAIGSDKENIERIYGDSFLDISDLTKLPAKRVVFFAPSKSSWISLYSSRLISLGY